MYNDMQHINGTLCLIPAKGCSTRLPKKNLLPLGGKPLISHVIHKAISSQLFKKVCVSTESQEIADVAMKDGADVPFIRPEALSHDPSTIVDVVLHALDFYEEKNELFKNVCVLLPTTPFLNVDDIRNAFKTFESAKVNTLLSVTLTEFPPYNAWLINSENDNQLLSPCFPDSVFRNTKSTECPKTYRSNGAVMITNVYNLKHHKDYRSGGIVSYVMPRLNSVDIDIEEDYQYAKFLYERGNVDN